SRDHARVGIARLMKELGYGKDYQYAHNFPEAQVEQEHPPSKLAGRRYYRPVDRGWEREIKRELDRRRRQKDHSGK
ncbi:MAG TPA: replication-associated recombination protein A, partial [Thermodesulfobacteriota bacterium]|nr:replication-associated recombination protein A [Thermodesulfobacteriota bacterium]